MTTSVFRVGTSVGPQPKSAIEPTITAPAIAHPVCPRGCAEFIVHELLATGDQTRRQGVVGQDVPERQEPVGAGGGGEDRTGADDVSLGSYR